MSEGPDSAPAAILDRMTDAFFALDRDRRFTYVNDRAATILSEAARETYAGRELIGHGIWEVIPDAVGTTFYEHYERALDEQEAVAFEDFYDPLDAWFAVRAYPSPSGLSVYFRDITDRKREERRLRRQAQQFAGFGDILTHDLKNPLSVAQGRLRQARETEDLDQLDPIEESLKRMESLLDEMAAVMDEGALVDDIGEVQVHEVIETVWLTRVNVDASLQIETELTIRADETALRRLLDNVLGNAVEHGGDSVTVRLDADSQGFYLEDDGPGIPPARRRDVFEPGFTTTETGDGLGMVSIRQIALAHGWGVEIRTGRDGGTRLVFTDVDVV